MILLWVLILGAPPIAPASVGSTAAASVASATPIDWANHEFTMFTLSNGTAGMREYSPDGPHDYQRWTLDRAETVLIAGAAHTLVLIKSLYSAPSVSRESLTAYLFKGREEVGRPIRVPTPSARITVQGDVVSGRWRVGKTRYSRRWRATSKGLISLGKPSTLRPRALGH